MKNWSVFVFGLTMVLGLLPNASFAAEIPSELLVAEDLRGGWEKLGSKKVNFGLDRDEIIVTARDGRFTKLKIKVKKGGINMHKMVVHFGDGGTQNVAMRNNIGRGGESRVIDLQGGKRVIKKVVFWYDTKNLSARRAKIELWGRH